MEVQHQQHFIRFLVTNLEVEQQKNHNWWKAAATNPQKTQNTYGILEKVI